jgi:integrase
VGSRVLAELKQAHIQYNLNKLAMGPAFKDSGLVFSREDGGAYRPESLTKMWRRFLQKYELKDIRFHDLRHSCATALLEAGVDPKTVQTRLGHADIAMTMNIYAHCTPNMDRNAAQKLDELFANAI